VHTHAGVSRVFYLLGQRGKQERRTCYGKACNQGKKRPDGWDEKEKKNLTFSRLRLKVCSRVPATEAPGMRIPGKGKGTGIPSAKKDLSPKKASKRKQARL